MSDDFDHIGIRVFDAIDVFRSPVAPNLNFALLEPEKGVEFPLYRYTKRRWADELLEHGRIRLNTLFFFTESEELNLAQRDDGEGVISVTARGADGIPILFTTTTTNCWLFCLSDKCSRNLMNDFEADTILQINDMEFFAKIGRAAVWHSECGRLERVKYYSENDLKNFDLTKCSHLFASECKSNGYAHQNEIRFRLEDRARRKPRRADGELQMGRIGFGQKGFEPEGVFRVKNLPPLDLDIGDVSGLVTIVENI